MDIQVIKDAKIKKGLTLKQIAEQSGVPIRTVEDIFDRTTTNPRIDTVDAIKKVLDISPDGVILSEMETRLLRAFNALIPNMQNFIISTVEELAEQPQNKRKNA